MAINFAQLIQSIILIVPSFCDCPIARALISGCRKRSYNKMQVSVEVKDHIGVQLKIQLGSDVMPKRQ